MTPAEQEALDAARAELERIFPDSPIMSGDEMRREKEAARVQDWNRIAEGKATPQEIQQENSPFSAEQVQSFRISNTYGFSCFATGRS